MTFIINVVFDEMRNCKNRMSLDDVLHRFFIIIVSKRSGKDSFCFNLSRDHRGTKVGGREGTRGRTELGKGNARR